MSETEKIIKSASKKIHEMLFSVCNYNKELVKNKQQEKLLNKILFAISVVDRKYFYLGKEAYEDMALPIGLGQTISQPSTVARMLILSDIKEGDEILEVGAGSGWNAALIAFLVYPGHVTSIERLNSLKEKAEKNLSALKNYLKQKKPEAYQKLEKINFFAESIFEKGKSWKKKYDKIIITAGIKNEGEKIEFLAKELLKQKGILICPRVSGPLIIYKKNGKLKKQETREEYVFVPLIE